MSSFVGRQREMSLLKDLLRKKTASLVVVYGRRRIGKSRLIEEFGLSFDRQWCFSGLPPHAAITHQQQLNEFSEQMSQQSKGEKTIYSDWSDVWNDLAVHAQEGRTLVFLDEISWMGSCDPNFLGKLKIAWDTKFKKNPNLVMVLCGSVSSWIDKNILSGTGFYGRISLKIRLKELSLSECGQFFLNSDKKISPDEQLKILSVTGGVPKYLEEFNGDFSAEENIKKMCFSPSGILFNDYDYIFSSLLHGNKDVYQMIVSAVCDRKLEQSELLNFLMKQSGGSISEYLKELVVSGFLERDYLWSLKTGKVSKLSQYRLSDNYLRFYLKYIRPNEAKILNNQFENHSLSSFPAWNAIMGLQFENLIVNNRNKIKEILKIYPEDVVFDNPYFQRKTDRYKGCQVDYLIHSRWGVLYLCEIKSTRQKIGMDVVYEVREKMESLSAPKRMSIKPVLIHNAEVSDQVWDTQFFSAIIGPDQLCPITV